MTTPNNTDLKLELSDAELAHVAGGFWGHPNVGSSDGCGFTQTIKAIGEALTRAA
jgi:hypothetical protein